MSDERWRDTYDHWKLRSDRDEFSDEIAPAQQCDDCGGTGMQRRLVPKCCGNLTKSGDCRAYCAVPEEIEEQCLACGGRGSFPTPPPAEEQER